MGEYYAPGAKKRWCLSLYDSIGEHALGVFSHSTTVSVYAVYKVFVHDRLIFLIYLSTLLQPLSTLFCFHLFPSLAYFRRHGTVTFVVLNLGRDLVRKSVGHVMKYRIIFVCTFLVMHSHCTRVSFIDVKN